MSAANQMWKTLAGGNFQGGVTHVARPEGSLPRHTTRLIHVLLKPYCRLRRAERGLRLAVLVLHDDDAWDVDTLGRIESRSADHGPKADQEIG